MPNCPKCNSTHVKKNGRSPRAGLGYIQQYKCCDCNKKFDLLPKGRYAGLRIK